MVKYFIIIKKYIGKHFRWFINPVAHYKERNLGLKDLFIIIILFMIFILLDIYFF